MNQHFLSDVSQLGKYVVERFLSPNKPTPEELEQILESFSLFIIQQDKEGRQKDVDEKYEAFKAAQRRLRHLANLTLEQMRDTDITRRLEKAALDALATTADPESRSPAETKTDADNQESGAVLAPSKLLGKN